MKLNRDNYEMHMFDLLEGNLSEREELHLMEQIEADEFLFREWKLFKSTILIADQDVVYTNKESLLKEERALVVPMYTRWVAVAASVCIFAAAWVLWPKSTAPDVVVEPLPTNTVKPQDTTISASALDEVEMQIEIIDAPMVAHKPMYNTKQRRTEQLPQKKDIATSERNENEVVSRNLPVEDTPIEKIADIQKVLLPKVDIHAEELDPVIAQEEVEEISENTSEPLHNEDDYIADNKDIKGKLFAFVTNNPIERIMNTADKILANVKDPKVKIERKNSGIAGLSIHVETSGYTAIASLQPFKNKN